MAKKSNLFQELVVEFEEEEGIDVGALTVEYFTKLFEIVRRDRFETVKSGTFLIPKRSGGYLTLFKILGITVVHSLLQGGPPFPYLHPWCHAMITQRPEEEIVGLISKEKYTELIPFNAGTANVINFLNALSRTKSEKDIDDLFECTEGQAFEQVVNATQWPIDTKITMNNIETLKAMIIWDELICKREKQLNAIRDGLAYVEFLPLLISHSELLSEYFLGSDKKITAQLMIEVIQWETDVSDQQKKALEFLKRFIEKSDLPTLTSFLKFSTGHCFISSLNDPKIRIEYLDESKVMLEGQSCFSISYLPIKYDQYDDFKKCVNTSLQLGCEGYANI